MDFNNFFFRYLFFGVIFWENTLKFEKLNTDANYNKRLPCNSNIVLDHEKVVQDLCDACRAARRPNFRASVEKTGNLPLSY